MANAAAFALAAEQLVGTRFRLRGRRAKTGIDCVGLVLLALRNSGRTVPDVTGYGLRNHDYSFLSGIADAAGFETVDSKIAMGDVLVVTPGPAQRHLLIASARHHFIHAHAGIGKVVRMPGPVSWPITNIYRLKQGT